MEKFTKTNAERYIKTSNDAQVAQLGHLNALVDSLNNMSSTLQGFKSDFVEGTLGPKVSFEKTYGGTEKDIIIPGVLELTRPNSGSGGLINAAIENSFISGVSPQNTVWCSKLKTNNGNPGAYSKNSGINYGWAAISNVRNFDYTVWFNSFYVEGWGPITDSMVTQNLEFVMRHTPTDRYWLIKFKSWGQGNVNDRSFSYDRWEIFPKTDFVRPANSPSTVDVISSGTILKRDDSQDLLYNVAKETKSAYTSPPNNIYQFPKSPLGTLWNSRLTDGRKDYNGWSNLSTIKNRIYSNLWGALGGDFVSTPNDLELVMLDQATGYYYTVEFTNWSTNGDGAVSYTRRLIPMITSIDFKDSVINGGGGAIDYAAIANNMHFDGYEFYVEKTFPAVKIENIKGIPLELLPNLALNNQYYDFKVLFEFKAGNLIYTDISNPYELQYGPNVIATYPVTTLKASCSFGANSSVSLPSGAATNRILLQGSNTKVVFTVNPASSTPIGGDGVLKAKVFYNIYSIT